MRHWLLRLGVVSLFSGSLLTGCGPFPASMFAYWLSATPEAMLSEARSLVQDDRATLASPIETLNLDEARRRYHVVSFDFQSDERVFVLKLLPSNDGFTTVNQSYAMTRDGTLVKYTSVIAIYAERGRTLLAVHMRNPQLEADGDASVQVRITSGSRTGTTNDPTFSTSLKSLATSVVMERNELSLGDTYRAMGWTDGPATVELRILTRDELSHESLDLAHSSLIASAASDGMFAIEGVLSSEYPGDDRLRTLNESDFCQLPFVADGKLAALHTLTIRPKDQIGKPPQPMASSAPPSN